MSDHITPADLNKPLNEDFSPKEPEREHVWVIPDRYLIELGLNPMQAMCYVLIRQTGRKKGYSQVSYSYLKKYTHMKDDKTIARLLKELEEKKLLYIHRYMSRQGKRFKFVHPDNAGMYWAHLTHINQLGERKRFEEEFMVFQKGPPDPDAPPPPKTTPPTSKNTENPHAKLAKGETPYAAKGETPYAINTTYLHYMRNGVTCKSPDGPAAAKAASTAASSSKLKEELEQSFSAQDTAVGLKWYEIQSEAKRSSMKKPIACIIQAIKGGYAHEEVAAQNKEVAAKLEQDREVKDKKELVKKEMSSNEKLAHQLIFKFSHLKGWRHKLDGNCFVVYNDIVEKVRDEETGASVCFMPDGTKRYGTPAVRVDFDLSHGEFRDTLKEFFTQSHWTKMLEEQKAQA